MGFVFVNGYYYLAAHGFLPASIISYVANKRPWRTVGENRPGMCVTHRLPPPSTFVFKTLMYTFSVQI